MKWYKDLENHALQKVGEGARGRGGMTSLKSGLRTQLLQNSKTRSGKGSVVNQVIFTLTFCFNSRGIIVSLFWDNQVTVL